MNDVKDISESVNESVKNVVKSSFSQPEKVVNNVNFTAESLEKIGRTVYISEVVDKRREQCICIGVLAVSLLFMYYFNTSIKYKIYVLILIAAYALWRDVFNFFLYLAELTKVYIATGIVLLSTSVVFITALPTIVTVIFFVVASLLLYFSWKNNDIYMVQQYQEVKKDNKNYTARLEREHDKLRHELDSYTRFEQQRKYELKELHEQIECCNNTISQLELTNEELLNNINVQDAYVKELEEVNNHLRMQINANNSIKEVAPSAAPEEQMDISERDRQILRYLNNTMLSYREIGKILNISYGTVKNVKQKYNARKEVC